MTRDEALKIAEKFNRRFIDNAKLTEIAEALLATDRAAREDCAKIAKDFPAEQHGYLAIEPIKCARQVADEIASAIRASMGEKG